MATAIRYNGITFNADHYAAMKPAAFLKVAKEEFFTDLREHDQEKVLKALYVRCCEAVGKQFTWPEPPAKKQ